MQKNNKVYPTALAYKLHKNWTTDGTIKRCQAIYTQGQIKIFFPEFIAWHRYLKMIPCKKAFAGLFVNHGKVWIPHIALASKLKLAEFKTLQQIKQLNKGVTLNERIGMMVETYCDRLPKSRQKALWLNANDLGVLDIVGIFKGETWRAWQQVVDAVREAEIYYQSHPWAQTRLGTNLMANIDFKANAAQVLAIEAAYLTKMPFKQMNQITLGYHQETDTFTSNGLPYMGQMSMTLAETHEHKYYPTRKLDLFNGLAG